MAKHTPGSWHVTAFIREPDASAPGGLRAKVVSSASEVADGYLISAGNSTVAEIRLRGRAGDAHLIAAAPDLLAALQEAAAALAVISNQLGCTHPGLANADSLPPVRGFSLEAFHRARTAIARAEGR